MFLALSCTGEQRPDIYHPNKLREAVADLLIKAETKRKNKIRYYVGKVKAGVRQDDHLRTMKNQVIVLSVTCFTCVVRRLAYNTVE